MDIGIFLQQRLAMRQGQVERQLRHGRLQRAQLTQVLKAKWPSLKVYAVEPVASPVIFVGAPALHPIQGSGATVLGFNYDTGERYLSVEGFLPA
jgi:hypothetical protein